MGRSSRDGADRERRSRDRDGAGGRKEQGDGRSRGRYGIEVGTEQIGTEQRL